MAEGLQENFAGEEARDRANSFLILWNEMLQGEQYSVRAKCQGIRAVPTGPQPCDSLSCEWGFAVLAAHKFNARLLPGISSVFHTFFGGGIFVLLTLLLPSKETENKMARYSSFLGRRVEVQYRAGDILLPASGTLVADSGRSIFLEQHFEQRGQHKHFRWEIPYQYLVRIEEKPDSGASANTSAVPTRPTHAPEGPPAAEPSDEPLKAAARAGTGGAPGILPLPNRPKTA